MCVVTCYLNSWPRMCLVHSRSCVKMLAMCKACPTLPPCSSCTPSPSCAHALTRTRTGCDVKHVTRHTSHVTHHTSRSYSDTPFDAFVAFSNVIVRPFFQNYFKRREVCPVQLASLAVVACASAHVCAFATGASVAATPCFQATVQQYDSAPSPYGAFPPLFLTRSL